ncbi:cytochrome C oxidase subunit IV family protein [Leisingera caerulea]|uniref:cytochrome C oxidase subunit IV family protein n=1 Tax=Leisingera caerulea TaxID=506591 RepID=UPI0021A4BE86|nr:cytochrome C oxidase subunit IV family protein [Leisingera caerulea]UWQ50706.1 cytochrome C oxidase subunit IV family protein [Leisingera caerulea]
MTDTPQAMDTGSMAHDEGQQHPIKLYFVVWVLLFILSAASYWVDYAQLQGLLRWSLILIFMTLKAGLIIAVFMHMAWERLALIYAILLPPLAMIGLLAILIIESDYTADTRVIELGQGAAAAPEE